MAKIRAKNTKPEMAVRRLLHKAGYRYRLHVKNLPGKPDIVFVGRRKVIFVHGCFWHQHSKAKCLDSRRPKSNSEYWDAKLTRNVERDQQHTQKLSEMGWDVLTLWECELQGEKQLLENVEGFLGSPRMK